MKRIARLIGLFSAFLFLFLAALVISQQSLRKYTAEVREETLAQTRARLVAALEFAGVDSPPVAPEVASQLETALGARIRWVSAGAPEPVANENWRFVHPIDATHALEVTIATPPTVRLMITYQRSAAALLTLALCLLFLLGALLFWNIRAPSSASEPRSSDPEGTRASLLSLQHLASVSVRQEADLEHERTERLRVEENLHIKQLLLNRSLEQKIRLGQDLHDGIIQSLYATGLTLEATRNLIEQDPTAASVRIGESTKALNNTIREIRAYINGLSPDTLRSRTFAAAVDVLTRDLGADRSTEFVVSIDEATALSLPETVATDLLQIVREAVSNSLRHGRASRIEITLDSQGGDTSLRIVDDGSGFSADQRNASGHGLENIESRIQRHRGSVSIQSTPARGTAITCILPAATAATTP